MSWRLPDGTHACTHTCVDIHIYTHVRATQWPIDGLCIYGLCSCGLHSYGLHCYGLHSYGLHSYGLYSHGLHSYGTQWPIRGFWNPSEFDDWVGPCLPSERCLGGQFAECAAGYAGRYCSLCQPGYYLQFKLCQPCGEDTTTILLYTACGIFVGLFTVCVFFMPNEVMNHIFGTITMLQTFRGLAMLGIHCG